MGRTFRAQAPSRAAHDSLLHQAAEAPCPARCSGNDAHFCYTRTMAARILILIVLLPALAFGRKLADVDVLPMPLGKDDAGARELIARQEWAAAAAAVTADSPGARFVKGWLLERAGKGEAALAALKGVEKDLPLLTDLANLTRGEAFITLERWNEAAQVLARVPTKGPTGWAAARERARALREAGKIDEARVAYQALVLSARSAETPVGLLGLARIEADAGQKTKAIELLRRLDIERPDHWTAREARTLAGTLTKKDPKAERLWNERTLDQQITRGEALAEANQNETAIAALSPLTKVKLTATQACRQRYHLARALRKLRQWEDALPRIQEAVKLCADAKHELAPWTLHLAAAAAERLSHEDDAAAYNQAQLDRHPDHRLADDAGFFLVRHHLDDRKDYQAAKLLAELLVKRFPDGDMVPEALFFVAIEAIQQKKYKEAREILALEERLKPRPAQPHDNGRTVYWMARLDDLGGDRKAAIEGYAATLASAPYSWYAIMAYSRLKEHDPKRALAAAAPTPENPGPTLPAGDTEDWTFKLPPELDTPDFDQALLLARLGLADQAWAALDTAGLTKDRPDLVWICAWILDRAGNFNRSHDLLRRKLPEFQRFPPVGNLRKHWEIAFPDPFGTLVKKGSTDNGVERFLIWGIMREESGFNPAVSSWASAVGLMQLILPTAQSMQDKKEKKATREMLKIPATNVRLGSKYLATVQQKTGAQWALVPAGYNAGYGALKKWLEARGHLPLDLFVETIPYEEARWYTKRVIASYGTYRALYGGKLADPLPYFSQSTKL
jgi:soluble lytic murein transglycosylase